MSEQEKDPMEGWKPSARFAGKADFLSIEDGESVDLRVLDKFPREAFKTTFQVDGKYYPVTLTKEGSEAVKAKGLTVKKVNAVNVIDRRDGSVKVWEFSEFAKGSIYEMSKRWKKLPTEFDITISRTGKKLATRYTLTISPNQEPLTDSEKALEKINLAEYYTPNQERLESLLKGEVPKRPDAEKVDEKSKVAEPQIILDE